MNELVNYNEMTDDELELRSSQLMEARLSRFVNKLKSMEDTVEKVGVKVELLNNSNEQLKNKLDEQTSKVTGLEDTLKITSIDRFQHDELQDIMKKRVFHFVGKIGSDKYILFFSGYKSGLVGSVKQEFGESDIPLSSIKDLKKIDFENAKNYINKWVPNYLDSKILSNWIVKDNNEDLKPNQVKALYRIMSKILENKESN